MSSRGVAAKSIKTSQNRSERGGFSLFKAARLILEDGTEFMAKAPGWQAGSYSGEVVFNTGMIGYVESLTDPSYTGQILVFTYPLIGNYGVQLASVESQKISVSGVIVSAAALQGSHSLADENLMQWLKSQNVALLTSVDTRSLTKYLRSRGTMAGTILHDGSGRLIWKSKPKLPTSFVSVDKPVIYNKQYTKQVILVDCGTKENILRSLLQMAVKVKRVPYNYDYTNENFDGVLLSNGPGDPADYKETIAIAKKAMQKNKPVFGICLGSQIMGLAAGAKTYKLKFGHRGHNQPCLELDQKRGYITSQNHGYAIDESTLPTDWKVSFRNLNDDSVEGIEHISKPFFSVQFHPEACPGPTDTNWLFDKFYTYLK